MGVVAAGERVLHHREAGGAAARVRRARAELVGDLLEEEDRLAEPEFRHGRLRRERQRSDDTAFSGEGKRRGGDPAAGGGGPSTADAEEAQGAGDRDAAGVRVAPQADAAHWWEGNSGTVAVTAP